jgi:arginase
MTRILVPYHLDERLADLDFPLRPDMTIATDLPAGDPWSRMAHLYERVAASVENVVRSGARPIVISGDCTTSLGTIAGLQRAGLDPAIIWLDAHGDVQTLETTASGYLGGMPLRILVGYRPELISEILALRVVREDRVLLVGARDLDPPELRYLEQAAIHRCGVDELHAADLPAGPLYLHLDADVVDPGELPGLLFPAPGGPPMSQVTAALRRVFESGRVAAFGLACSWRSGRETGERLRPHLETAMLAGAPGV